MNAEILEFFRDHMDALPVWEALEAAILARFPQAETEVKKTQISFRERRVFACVSFLAPLRSRDMPRPHLTLTLGFPCPMDSPRVAAAVPVRPGRWTHHIVLSGPRDVDGELLNWIGEARAFARRP